MEEEEASATCATASPGFIDLAAAGGATTVDEDVVVVRTTLPFPSSPADAGSVDNCSMPTTNVPINIAGIDAAVSIWTPTGNSPSLSWIPFFPLKFEFVVFKALHFCEFLLFFLFTLVFEDDDDEEEYKDDDAPRRAKVLVVVVICILRCVCIYY